MPIVARMPEIFLVDVNEEIPGRQVSIIQQVLAIGNPSRWDSKFLKLCNDVNCVSAAGPLGDRDVDVLFVTLPPSKFENRASSNFSSPITEQRARH